MSFIDNLKEKTLTFKKLLELLIVANDDYKGPNIPIPEIILFDKGKPVCLLKYNKHTKEIKKNNNKAILQLPVLMEIMVNEYNNRRRSHIVSKVKVYSRPGTSVTSNTNNRIEKLKISEALMANVKYNNTITPSLLSQKQFTNFMMQQANSKIWCNISYIQNYVVVSTVISENYVYNYIAPINNTNPNIEIVYSLKHMDNSFEGQSKKLCTIICDYISKVHDIVNFIIEK